MKSVLLGALVALSLLATPATSGDFIQVNAPIDHSFQSVKPKEKNRSTPETSWVCQTPVNWCTMFWSNGIGSACSCWGVWGVIVG